MYGVSYIQQNDIKTVRRGEIYFAYLEGIDLEQSEVLVLQNNIGNKYSPTTIVAKLDIKNQKPYTISTISFKQIYTIDKKRLIRKVFTLNKETMEDVDKVLELNLGLTDLHTAYDNQLNKLPSIKRGEIYFADFNEGVGSEQNGIRPILTLQNDGSTIVVASITSILKKQDLLVHYQIDKEISKLPQTSIILLEQIKTISSSQIIRKVSTLSEKTMEEIDHKLKISLGLTKIMPKQ